MKAYILFTFLQSLNLAEHPSIEMPCADLGSVGLQHGIKRNISKVKDNKNNSYDSSLDTSSSRNSKRIRNDITYESNIEQLDYFSGKVNLDSNKKSFSLIVDSLLEAANIIDQEEMNQDKSITPTEESDQERSIITITSDVEESIDDSYDNEEVVCDKKMEYSNSDKNLRRFKIKSETKSTVKLGNKKNKIRIKIPNLKIISSKSTNRIKKNLEYQIKVFNSSSDRKYIHTIQNRNLNIYKFLTNEMKIRIQHFLLPMVERRFLFENQVVSVFNCRKSIPSYNVLDYFYHMLNFSHVNYIKACKDDTLINCFQDYIKIFSQQNKSLIKSSRYIERVFVLMIFFLVNKTSRYDFLYHHLLNSKISYVEDLLPELSLLGIFYSELTFRCFPLIAHIHSKIILDFKSLLDLTKFNSFFNKDEYLDTKAELFRYRSFLFLGYFPSLYLNTEEVKHAFILFFITFIDLNQPHLLQKKSFGTNYQGNNNWRGNLIYQNLCRKAEAHYKARERKKLTFKLKKAKNNNLHHAKISIKDSSYIKEMVYEYLDFVKNIKSNQILKDKITQMNSEINADANISNN
ncbi:hypothetical protein TUBRATIS_10280 [Tubulinosema ratisbonensis]|uniref:Uncharacterized protein n=1 Tax=Tubulinosema ratisbonensis TaxID=291195 RepID=A0A437AMM9_9MICR|nr:hypothetical protein TUBRATIS_10280 [Tubulinosema ratisbonensis]